MYDQISFMFARTARVAGIEKTGDRKPGGSCQDDGGLHKGPPDKEYWET